MSMLINENQQFDMNKTSFITTYNNQNSNYQPIIQNIQTFNKEIVAVSPMLKIEANIDCNKPIRHDQSQDSQNVSSNMKVEAAPIKKSRGHIDRYNGLSEEEVVQRTLPDYLKENLDLIVVGINPSMTSACVGHHYAGIGNHFWTCIAEAGLVPETVTCYDDYRMVDYGIGFTNVCSRPTKGAAEISRKEMKAGALIMVDKMRKYKPKIAVFNGKGIYEAFIGHKNFYMGKQPKPLDGTDIIVFVMPSSSARCAQLPRAEDKLPFFIALRKLRDFVNGDLTFLSDQEIIFSDYTEFRVTQPDPKSLRKAERRRKRKAEQMLGSNCSSDILVSSTGGKSRKSKSTYSIDKQQQIIKPENHVSTVLSANKDCIDLNINNTDLTPVTITTEESIPQMDMPIALYNQSTGVISLVSSCDMFGGSNAFAIANGNSVIMLPSNNNNKSGNLIQNKTLSQVVSKPLIVQQDVNGQTYILASPSQFLQTSNQIQNSPTTTLVPIGTANGNTIMALLQPGQMLTTSGQVIDTGTATISWIPQNQIQSHPQAQQHQQPQSQQQHQQQRQQFQQTASTTQFITQTSSNGGSLVYQQPKAAAAALNSVPANQPTQQFICTTATLQQLLQQQQHQQSQSQIISQIGYPQQFTIQTPLSLANGIQLQPITNCLSDNINTGGDSIHNQDQLSNDDSGQRSTNQETVSQSGTTTTAAGPGSMIIVSTNHAAANHQSINNSVGNQAQFGYINPSTQHIVIPLNGGGGGVNGGSGDGGTTTVATGSVVVGGMGSGIVTGTGSLLQLADVQKLACLNQQQSAQICQLQLPTRSRPLTSSSSTSGISSVTGQGDIDLLSSSNGVLDSSQLYQHCSSVPVQLADCEDQLVQCSSSDEKLLYSAL